MILMLFCISLYFIIWKTINNYMFYVILNRICIFLFLIIFRKKLPKIQKLYKKLWNRNDTVSKKMKSTTFRALNLVLFNIMFYVINVCMIFIIYQNGGV